MSSINERPALTCETLSELEYGEFGDAVNEEIRRVMQDCYNRANAGTRTVTIKLTFKPKVSASDTDLLEGVDVTPSVNSSLPARKGGDRFFMTRLNHNREPEAVLPEGKYLNAKPADMFDRRASE